MIYTQVSFNILKFEKLTIPQECVRCNSAINLIDSISNYFSYYKVGAPATRHSISVKFHYCKDCLDNHPFETKASVCFNDGEKNKKIYFLNENYVKKFKELNPNVICDIAKFFSTKDDLSYELKIIERKCPKCKKSILSTHFICYHCGKLFLKLSSVIISSFLLTATIYFLSSMIKSIRSGDADAGVWLLTFLLVLFGLMFVILLASLLIERINALKNGKKLLEDDLYFKKNQSKYNFCDWASNGNITNFIDIINESPTTFIVDQQDQDGNTPLISAVKNGHKFTVELLLKLGANVEIKDNFGKTALDYSNDLEITNMLNEENILFKFIREHNYFMVKTLLERGVNPIFKDKQGNSALKIAEDNNSYFILKLLQHREKNKRGQPLTCDILNENM